MGMRRKGQWNIPLIVGAFVLMASLPFLQTGIAGAAELVLQQKVFANRASLHAAAAHDHLDDDYMREAMNWSAYQASYDLAADGGGADWRSGPPGSSTIRANLEREIEQVISSGYLDGGFTGLCRFDDGSISVDVKDSGDALRTTSSVGSPPTVRCWAKGNNVTVPISTPSEVSSPNNRYFDIYRAMTGLVEEVRGILDSVERREFTGSGSSCGGSMRDARSEARSDAEARAEEPVRMAFDFYMDGASVEDPFTVSWSSLGVDTASSIEDTNAEQEACSCEPVYETNEDGEIVVGDDGEPVQAGEDCDETLYTATATAEPTGATATLGIRDAGSRIPTAEGPRNLEFVAKTIKSIE